VDAIPDPRSLDCVLVAVDGVDAAGKTIFADALAAAAREAGRAATRISLDDFHNPLAIRHQRGRKSPEGFWLDSYDYERFTADVLTPLGPGGTRRYRPKAHDLQTDTDLDTTARLAPPGCIVIIDGLFLHRDELRDRWDCSVFLDVPFEVTARRMAARDGLHPDPEHVSMRRYVGGQRLYLMRCDPRSRASIVIDNSDPDQPRVVRASARRTDGTGC
jgi:uridine kinase